MENFKNLFKLLIEDFSKHPLIEGILLAGSRATENIDIHSDYDIYIYSNEEIPLDFRKNIANKYFSYFELNNTTWEMEDQAYFKDSNIQIDIVYRNLNWIEEVLENIVFKHQASTGYTTCFWANIINSKILFDKNGKLQNLKNKYSIKYPEELRKNIINKNYPLLNTIIPAYTKQIKKALDRQDYISVNHRVSAFFESYFDIIFAINKILHPGEKKLLKIVTKELDIIPKNMENNIETLFENMYSKDFDIIKKLEELSNELKTLLVQLKLM